MKLILLVALIFMTAASSNQKQPHSGFNVTTFTEAPKDMEGAGESFYLSGKDKKEGKFICATNYMTALIYINQKAIRLETMGEPNSFQSKQMFTHGKFILIIVKNHVRKVGDENYTMKGIITLK